MYYCFLNLIFCSAVVGLVWVVNKGQLVTACSDDCIYLWDVRQPQPELLQMIRFNKERLTTLYLGRTINKLFNYFVANQHHCLPRSQAFINSVLNTILALNMHWSFV